MKMSFFNTKPKVTKAVKDETTIFNIKYYKSKAPEKYKSELLGRIFAGAPTLAVINTRFMYKEQKSSFLNDQQKLLDLLNVTEIKYRRIPVTRKEEMSIFGLSVRPGEAKLYQDYVIGLMLEPGEVETAIKLFRTYSLYYYINWSNGEANDILDIFEASYDDDTALKGKFECCIFDDNFMETMAIYCKGQAASRISSILE